MFRWNSCDCVVFSNFAMNFQIFHLPSFIWRAVHLAATTSIWRPTTSIWRNNVHLATNNVHLAAEWTMLAFFDHAKWTMACLAT